MKKKKNAKEALKTQSEIEAEKKNTSRQTNDKWFSKMLINKINRFLSICCSEAFLERQTRKNFH